jgi:hypothetical protein
VNGSKAPPDLLVHPSNKQKHRSYCYQFADYCIYEYSVKAFVFNVLSVVHPKTGAPLPKKCTVHQREGCTSEAEHPDGSVSEKETEKKSPQSDGSFKRILFLFPKQSSKSPS